MDQLQKCDANYVPLTPVTFLKRASAVYANRTSVIYEGTRFTWRQTYERCCRLADSLRSLNVGKNDVVSSSIFVLGFSFDFLTYRIIIFNVFFVLCFAYVRRCPCWLQIFQQYTRCISLCLWLEQFSILSTQG